MTSVAQDTRIVRPDVDSQALWGHFLDNRTGTYYGTCQAIGDDGDFYCADPWSLHLPTATLKQCGCDRFTPGTPFIPMVAAILGDCDLTPAPRRTRWFTLACPSIVGCGAWQDGWWLDGITREVIPCMSCGWSPDQPFSWEH